MYSRAEVSLPLSMLIRLLEGFEFDWHRLRWSACVLFIHHARPAIEIEEYELNIGAAELGRRRTLLSNRETWEVGLEGQLRVDCSSGSKR